MATGSETSKDMDDVHVYFGQLTEALRESLRAGIDHIDPLLPVKEITNVQRLVPADNGYTTEPYLKTIVADHTALTLDQTIKHFAGPVLDVVEASPYLRSHLLSDAAGKAIQGNRDQLLLWLRNCLLAEVRAHLS